MDIQPEGRPESVRKSGPTFRSPKNQKPAKPSKVPKKNEDCPVSFITNHAGVNGCFWFP